MTPDYKLQRMKRPELIEEVKHLEEKLINYSKDAKNIEGLKQSLEVANTEAAKLSESLRSANAKGELAAGVIFKILMTFENQLALLTELAENYGFVSRGKGGL